MVKRVDIERQQQKLKLRSELLRARVQAQELRDKQDRIKQQLKNMR